MGNHHEGDEDNNSNIGNVATDKHIYIFFLPRAVSRDWKRSAMIENYPLFCEERRCRVAARGDGGWGVERTEFISSPKLNYAAC